MAARSDRLSPRLQAIVDALPIAPGTRVLEIGCGPGAAAREIARHIGDGHILAIDRSAMAVAMALEKGAHLIASGRMTVRHVAIEDFTLLPNEEPFDVAFAVRVGVLDGRHPERQSCAYARIAASLKSGGRLFVDGGNPLREIFLDPPSTE